MSDYEQLAKWLEANLKPLNVHEPLRALIRERDEATAHAAEVEAELEYLRRFAGPRNRETEARAKALEEAAAWCKARGLEISDKHLPVSAVNELLGAYDAILALREKPDTIIIDEASEMTPGKWDYVQSRLKEKP